MVHHAGGARRTGRRSRRGPPSPAGAALLLAVVLQLVVLSAPHIATAFHTAFVPKHYGRSSFVLPSGSRLRLAATVVAPTGGEQSSTWTTSSATSTTGAAGAYSTKTTTTPMSMLVETSGGMEELQELMDKSDGNGVLSKQVRSRPSLWKLAGYASIPVGAALGFGLVPSRRLAAHALGAVVTGIAGAVGKSRIDSLTEATAKPALASAIVDFGLDDPDETHQAVLRVQEQFGILDEDFEVLTVEIYAIYLMGMVKYNPSAKTSELKELEGLRTALGLNNLQVGEAHALAAAEWYRTTCLFTPEEELDDPDHPDRQAMDKLLFLTERALQGETPEAFKFEMTRVAKALHLDVTTAMERVSDVMEPFYQRALASTRSKLGTNQVSSGMLQRARQTLGVSDATAKDMHVACFNQEVRSLLGLPDATAPSGSGSDGETDSDEAAASVDLTTVKFSDGAAERLSQLRDLLELTETDANYEISLEATPLYQATALKEMESVLDKTKTPDEAWSVMDARRQELLLNSGSTKDLLSSMVMQALGRPLEAANKFAKVNNEAATYDNLLEALEAKAALISIMAKSGWDEFEKFDDTFCNPWNRQSANGFLVTDERIKLYRVFLNRCLRKAEGGPISSETFDDIAAVKGLLGISDPQQEIEARSAFGPQLQKVMQRALMEIVQDYTPELAANMKKEMDSVVDNYRLSTDFVREVGASFYAKAVALVSEQSPGGIPTKELSAALESLRELFHLTQEDTFPSHNEYFGSVYKKSVLEAMGTTGVIRPEFKKSLDELQKRLGVSEADGKKLFLDAVEEKMKPMVEWIGSEMERTMLSQQQLSQRRGKDMGEDLFQTGKGAEGVLGLGAEVNLMSDIMELIDFYKENGLTEEVEVTRTGEDGQEETVTETVYPVTALGSGAIDQEMAELLYRQFIVGGFTTQGEKGARYESNRAVFAGIIGLDKSKIDEINSNIGSTVYDNFVSNAMKTKGALDQQDMMFLANIQTKLNITPEKGEKMLLDAQKKILSEEVNAIMDDPTPEAIKAFREKCNGMGIDLTEDVGVSKTRLTRMFEAEITPGLKDGSISADNSDILGEIQDSLGVDPDECESMFEAVLLRLSKNAIELVKGELLRGREENTVDLLKELVRYAAFTEGELGLSVEEATANQIFNVYEAFDFSDLDAEAIDANKRLLRAALGLP